MSLAAGVAIGLGWGLTAAAFWAVRDSIRSLNDRLVRVRGRVTDIEAVMPAAEAAEV